MSSFKITPGASLKRSAEASAATAEKLYVPAALAELAAAPSGPSALPSAASTAASCSASALGAPALPPPTPATVSPAVVLPCSRRAARARAAAMTRTEMASVMATIWSPGAGVTGADVSWPEGLLPACAQAVGEGLAVLPM